MDSLNTTIAQLPKRTKVRTTSRVKPGYAKLVPGPSRRAHNSSKAASLFPGSQNRGANCLVGMFDLVLSKSGAAMVRLAQRLHLEPIRRHRPYHQQPRVWKTGVIADERAQPEPESPVTNETRQLRLGH